jgi:PRC-barrel domain
MTKLLTTTALCMGLSLALAHAQQSTTQPVPQGSETPSATTSPPASQDPSKPMQAQPNTQPNVTVTSPSASTEKPSGGMAMSPDAFMQKQTRDQISAEDLIGANVYGANEEKIGDVSDLLMDNGGRVLAVVVGVGGFLGIGEKDVAVKFDLLDKMVEDDGDIRLTLSATKDQLKEAPEFAYLNEQRDESATGAVPPAGAPATPPSATRNPAAPAGGAISPPKQ